MLSVENGDGFSTIYLTLTPYGIKLVLPNMSRHNGQVFREWLELRPLPHEIEGM